MNDWISREKKDWFVAVLLMGAVLLLGAFFWRSGEPTRPDVGVSSSVKEKGQRTSHVQIAPGSDVADRDTATRPNDGAVSANGVSAFPSTPDNSTAEGKSRRRAGLSSSGDAPELTYVPASEPAPHNTESDGFQLAAGATNPDVVALAGTVRDYRSALGQNPVGNNAEITRALSGENARHAQFLPPDAVKNDAGELLDRWGHPYFFHAISRTEMEVHSAGPDGVMWSADDQVFR